MENIKESYHKKVITLINNNKHLKPKNDNDNDKDDIKWLYDNHKEIAKYIDETYKNEYTSKAYYQTLSMIVKQYDEKLYKHYINITFNKKKQLDEYEKESLASGSKLHNRPTDKEYDYVMSKYENNANYQDNQIYLFLYLYKNYPLRSEYCNLYITNHNSIDIKDIHTINYLTINNINKRIHVIINKDKVSHTKSHKNNRKINYNKEAYDIISSSYKLYPRKYLLTKLNDRSQPMNYKILDRMIKSVFNKHVNKEPSINILRSIFITNLFNNNLSIKNIEDKMKNMRSSINQTKSYYKINDNNINDDMNKDNYGDISNLFS